MTTSVPVIGVLLIGVLYLPAPAPAQQRPAIAEQIAKTYGFDSFGQLDAIRYTLTLDADKLKHHRSWIWEPKADQITYEGPDKDHKPVKITYVRSQLASQSEFVRKTVDLGFFTDQYWLLFPFHLVWDTDATIEDAGIHKLPLGKGSARKVVVKYPSTGGYLPGDTWILFVGTDGQIEELEWHGGPAEPDVVKHSWTNYQKAGPFLFSIERRGPVNGKPSHLYFSNVAVKLSGSSTWIEAK